MVKQVSFFQLYNEVIVLTVKSILIYIMTT